MINKYEELHELIGCFFNQDWICFGKTDEELVQEYLRNFHETLVDQCISEIDEIISEAVEGRLSIENFLEEINCEFAYQNFGYTGLEWLKRLKSLILKHRGQIKFAPLIKPDAGSQEPDSQ